MTSAPAPAHMGRVTGEQAPPATVPFSQETLDEGARRTVWLAAVVAIGIVAWHVAQRFAQPQIAPILDDAVNRLAALLVVLTAVGLIALHRYGVVTSLTLVGLGMGFEIAAALSIGLVETSLPFDDTTRLLGLSAIGPLIVFAGAQIPTRPGVRLTLALGAATMWPLALWINSSRFASVTVSTRAAWVWAAMNYLFAIPAFLLARRSYQATQAVPMAQELGSYQLISPIGEGGMGEVWRARHKMLARPAAIKLVKLDAGQAHLLALRFHREANAIAALQSPHTVYLYDFGTTQQGRLYYVMELLDGISLQTLVTTFGPQPASRVVAILRQTCRSLEEAHQKKLVHRDLKPSNVMLCQVATTRDFVKVLDFGLAKPFGTAETANLTVDGVTVGTPEYMAPEVAGGSRRIDARVDLYALGCVAYFLITGTLVFTDSSSIAIALKHMKTPPEPPSRRSGRSVPADLERLILKCLEKDPGARPASAGDVERMLAACNVPPWTDEDASAWWTRHLPPTSPLRTSSQAQPLAPLAARKA